MKERVEKNSTFSPQGTANGKLSSGKETLLIEETLQNTISLKTESESRSVVSYSLHPHGLYSPGISPGQNIGVGSLSLL